MKQNVSWREPPNLKVDGCFYSGIVSGEPGSVVAVSLCEGIVSILYFALKIIVLFGVHVVTNFS